MDLEILLMQLCRAALGDTTFDSSPFLSLSESEWTELLDFAKKQDLAHLVAEGVSALGLSLSDQVMARLDKESMIAIFRTEQMTFELASVKAALSEAEIPHIPLKGSVLRDLYPSLSLRVSTDIDLLVDPEHLEMARETLKNRLGYIDYAETPHDLSLRAPSGFLVELHFDLFESEKSPRIAALLSRVWEYARPSEESLYTYRLTDAMFYFYHLAHMAKHVLGGGCGIRPFLDLYILRKIDKIGDDDERAWLLEVGGLSRFEEVASHLALAWMEEDEMTQSDLALSAYVLDGGIFGNLENRIAMKCTRRKGRLRYLLSRVFPSFSAMKRRYPLLKRAPYLTPFAYIYRLFSPIWSKNKNKISNEAKTSAKLSYEDIETTKQLLADLGL